MFHALIRVGCKFSKDSEITHLTLYSSLLLQRHYRQVLTGNQAGVCRYGRRLECCYGWKKNSKGQCEGKSRLIQRLVYNIYNTNS